MEFYQISIIVGICFLIIEVFTFTYIFLGMGVALFAVAITQYLMNGFTFNRDLMVFAFVTVLVNVASRRIFKRRSDQNISTEEDINEY